MKNRPKDKWSLYLVAESMELAKKHSLVAIKQLKEMGYDNPDATIQSYASIHDIPKTLDKPKPEKLLYN
jgi:hypothetical protein